MTTTRFLAACAAAALLPAGPARAGDAPADVLARGIAATGGADKLAGLTSAEWETRAVALDGAGPEKRSAKLAGKLPAQFRVDLTAQVGGKPVTTSRVIDGDAGWTVKDGVATPMDKATLQRSRVTFLHKQAVQTLVPLRDPRFKLSPLPDAAVGGKPAAGVLAAAPGIPPLKLYFDRDSGLLVKSELTDEDPATGKPETVEMVFSAHRAFGGIKIPGRTETFRDGKKVREIELVDFRPNAAVDPARFRKP